MDNEELFSLFHDFYNVTGILSGVWDLNYHSIMRIRGDDLCRFLQKSNPDVTKGCYNCDQRAVLKCGNLRKGFLYRCHMGLWEYITPVFDGESIVGYASTGQMSDGTDAELKNLLKNTENYQLPEPEVVARYAETRHHSPEEIRSICTLFESCISHVYCRKLIQLTDMGLFQNIDRYISDHLDSRLNVAVLCRQFRISKSELYRLFSEYTDTGVSAFIKSKRMHLAKKLLETTKMNITEIADRTGYSDYSYFTKAFRSIYSITPRECRKNRKQAELIDTELPE